MKRLTVIPLFVLFSSSILANQHWEAVFKATEEARQRALEVQLPINAPKSSDFGMRFHPILHRDRLHRGIDFAAKAGTPFHAAGAGVVLYTEERGELGLTIAIQHKDGIVTRYGHASSMLVLPGDLVDKETVIGLVGSTGSSTDPHLHFELILNDEHVNPATLQSFYDPNEERKSLDERINSLLSDQQIEMIASLSPSTAEQNLAVPAIEVAIEPVAVQQQVVNEALPLGLLPVPLTTQEVALVQEAEPNDLVIPEVNALDIDTELPNSELQTVEAKSQAIMPMPETHVQTLPKTTWGIAEYLIVDTNFSIFQALSALVETNPKAFKDGNYHIRYSDQSLVLPDKSVIARQSHDIARAKYYETLPSVVSEKVIAE